MTSPRRIAALVLATGLAPAAGHVAHAGEGLLRLVPPAVQADAPMLGASQESLGELLAVTPRGGAMHLSLSTPSAAAPRRLGLDYASTAMGMDFALFGNLSLTGGDRFGVSALNPGLFGAHVPGMALADPSGASAGADWQVGGRIDLGGFSVGADLAQSDDLRLGRALTDYGLGMSYAGADWSIGMRYVRSLAALDRATPDVADAVHLGGTLQLSGSINLVGGVQYWDQNLTSGVPADNGGRSALVFFGTQIRF